MALPPPSPCNTADDDALGYNAEKYKEFISKHQRDINCLSDPQRFVRKKALVSLHPTVTQQDTTLSFLRHLWINDLQKPLLKCFSDSVEKVRELSILLVLEILTILLESQKYPIESLAMDILPTIGTRIGVVPLTEPAEEVRLELLNVVLTLVKHKCLSSCKAVEATAGIVKASSTDGFPDTKRTVATISSEMSLVVNEDWMKMESVAMAKALLLNLGHQHSKVRSMTLQALGNVLACGSSDGLDTVLKERVLPALHKIVFDRTASVRKVLVSLLNQWLMADKQKMGSFDEQLLPILLSIVSDPAPEVQIAAVSALKELGEFWDDSNRTSVGSTMEIDDDEMTDEEYGCPLSPFPRRPHRGVRAMASKLFTTILNPLLKETGDWTAQTRARSASTLRTLVILVEKLINPHLESILAALAKVCRDEEPEVVQHVNDCVKAVGRFADGETLFSVLVPLASGTIAGQDTPSHRTNGLVLLAMSIQGISTAEVASQLDRITSGLCDQGLLEAELPELHEQLANAAANTIDVANEALNDQEEYGFRLFWVLNQLIASTPEDSFAHEQSSEYLEKLASIRGQSLQELYRCYLPTLFEKMSLPTDVTGTCWTKSMPQRILFDSVCRRGGIACADVIETIVKVFVAHLPAKREADIRLAFLALLESMLTDDAVCKAFIPHCSVVLLECIMPNIIWCAGRVAATVRKIAIACTYSLLRQGLADKQCLYLTAPQMLPVLKSCMDDDDAKTRQLVCLALQYLFVALPNALSAEPVNELYGEILKRLDDSNDIVRKASCSTFIQLLQAAPSEHFKGTPIDYSLDCLFVHLDDPEPEMQDLVFGVIKATVPIDKALVNKKARENRTRHRNPSYCDRIIEITN